MNRLKEECKKYVLDKSQSGAYDLAGSIEEEIDELFNFINQNYISKEQILNLECLKEEKLIDDTKVDCMILEKTWEDNDLKVIRNQLRNEIKEEILENLKDIEIGEFEGWDLAHKFNCCPGDDMADAYNQALKDVIKLIKKL